MHWAILRRAGLPLGMPDDTTSAPPLDELARAVEAAIAEAPGGRSRDALAAFVLAWRRHWPHTFASAFASADEIAAYARNAVDDADRYLKLSRIAVANLARLL